MYKKVSVAIKYLIETKFKILIFAIGDCIISSYFDVLKVYI